MRLFKKKPQVDPAIPTPRDQAFALRNFVRRELIGNLSYGKITLEDAEDIAELYPDDYADSLKRWMETKNRDIDPVIYMP